jgi:hypothetical protein
MRKLGCLLVLAIAGCNADKIDDLEKQVESLEDDLAKERKKRRAAEGRYDELVTETDEKIK